MSLWAIFLTAFIVALSGALMPGPLLAVTIRESARGGAWTGPRLILGHALIEGAVVGAVALGFAGLLRSYWVIGATGLLGGTLMVLMGADMMIASSGLSLRDMREGGTSMHPVVAGVLVSLSNPYWTLWWVAVGVNYVLMGMQRGLVGVLVFFAGHILADLAWYTFVSVVIARGCALMSDSMYRVLVVLCGLAVFGFGWWFLVSGGTELFAV